MLGLEENLDVSIYAKSKYNFQQMDQIRFGLKNNLDVSVYAKPEYNYKQMKEIRIELLKEKENNEQNI